MRSFISNSRPPRRRGYGAAACLFAGAFLVLAAAGFFLSPALGPDHAWLGGAPEPGDCVVDEIDSDHFDVYDDLYYGLGRSMDNARKADVLLLGNSRTLFAFREDSVKAFCRQTGLRVFNLCFPANDGMVMAYEAILRNDLRPAFAVVNENQFFTLGRSPYGTDTAQEGRARARMRVWEHRLSWEARRRLHRLFPRFGFGDIYRVEPNVTYQSAEDGCLVYENFSAGRETYGIQGEKGASDLPEDELRLARKFKEALEERGTRLVLTDIPYDMESYVRARKLSNSLGALFLAPENLKPFHKAVKLARELKVPLVDPPLEGLRTLDGSHLTGESARKFADGFFARFKALEPVREWILKKPGKKPGRAAPED